jgi:hypothetical protein
MSAFALQGGMLTSGGGAAAASSSFMSPLLGIGLAVGGATSLLQGFLANQAQKKQNAAAQQAMRLLGQQSDFYNTSYKQRLALLSESQLFSLEGTLDAIPQMRRAVRQDYEQSSGAARAALAESGAAMSGSKADILRSIDIQGALNNRTLESNIRRSLVQDSLNYRSALFGATQAYAAQQFQIQNTTGQLQSQFGSSGLAMAQGALGGFGTGLSITSGIASLDRYSIASLNRQP